MKLDHLIIPDYRNLRSFEIDFDESQPTTVLLGHNGTGKSNLIEAIVEIFRELEAAKAPNFAYTLDYGCRDHAIHVDADPARKTKRLNITVDGKSVTQTDFQADLDTYLPSYVFAYYSGWSSRLERQFDSPTRKHYERVLNGQDMPLRRLFFCRREYSQLVLLAFFLEQSEGARRLLEEHLGIKRFESALFVLKMPWWAPRRAPSKTLLSEGDPRFWYARGAFKGFLGRLWERALAPIRNNETVERDIRRQPESTERLYLFLKNQDELSALKHKGEDTKTVFGYLESLFLCDLIDEVRVTVQRADDTRLNFPQLSEGEQQLLTVLGLLRFTQNDESLYLLDEPDTHLNPVWSYDFLDLLEDNISAKKGQLIVASHDPLMIGSLRKNQVRVLADRDNRIVAEEPEYDPIGIGIEGLLKTEIYGLPSSFAPEILQKLDRHYLLLGKPDKTDAERTELMRLANELNDLGVSRTHPNPYFEQFANAMARRRSPEAHIPLSREEIESQTELADQVLKEILSEERAGPEEGVR